MKIIELQVFGITITIDDQGVGSIISDLESGQGWPSPTAFDGLESLILAHACAGVDVESPAYLEGIETAVDAICNQVEDDDEDPDEYADVATRGLEKIFPGGGFGV